MKMMPCKSCDREISTKAENCPHCGHAYVKSFSARLDGGRKFALYFFLLPMAALFLGLMVMVATQSPG